MKNFSMKKQTVKSWMKKRKHSNQSHSKTVNRAPSHLPNHPLRAKISHLIFGKKTRKSMCELNRFPVVRNR
ncbi:Uncharacterised protein [Vibrio cholerae]|nr:Uncharacterised protein [Vibrio cholerae]